MENIVIDNLCKSYGSQKVLQNFSAVIPKGRITSMMAPSGFGKTTLLRILMGLEKADSGEIIGMTNCRLSIVFQEDCLCENLSAYANIRLVTEKPKEQIVRALQSVGLADCADQKVSELSGGMRRRVAILRALLAEYDLLLLDEPLKGLDKDRKHQVIEYILAQTKGKTVLLITHNEEEEQAFGVSQRIRI